MRCPSCGGYLISEPEWLENPARVRCVMGDWAVTDPNFRKEKPSYFPSDAVDRRIEWQQGHPDYDLYDPKSAACQLGISVSFFRESVKSDSSAPVIWGSRDDRVQHSGVAEVVGRKKASLSKCPWPENRVNRSLMNSRTVHQRSANVHQ
jgi:hypothetical protein